MLADIEVDAIGEGFDDAAECRAKMTELTARLRMVVDAVHGDVVLQRFGTERPGRLPLRLEESPREDFEVVFGLGIAQTKARGFVGLRKDVRNTKRVPADHDALTEWFVRSDGVARQHGDGTEDHCRANDGDDPQVGPHWTH